jgi:predicted signal transduction protein with EAL and GGDEF domain
MTRWSDALAQRGADGRPAVLVEYEGQRISVTVSIGIASVLPGELDLTAVMNRADQALYRAKALGRNRWYRAFGTADDEASPSNALDLSSEPTAAAVKPRLLGTLTS